MLELEKAVESGEVVLTEAQKNTLSIYVKPKVDEKDFAKVAGKSIEEKGEIAFEWIRLGDLYAQNPKQIKKAEHIYEEVYKPINLYRL